MAPFPQTDSTGSSVIDEQAAPALRNWSGGLVIATAMWRALRSALAERHLHASHMIVAGHSEGSVVAELMATSDVGAEIDGVVLLSGPAIGIFGIMREQLALSMSGRISRVRVATSTPRRRRFPRPRAPNARIEAGSRPIRIRPRAEVVHYPAAVPPRGWIRAAKALRGLDSARYGWSGWQPPWCESSSLKRRAGANSSLCRAVTAVSRIAIEALDPESHP